MNLVEITLAVKDEASKALDKLPSSAKMATNALQSVAVAAAGSGGLAVAGALGIAGVAVGAFAAVAKPELDKVQAAMSQTGAAGKKAWDNLTPGEKAIGTAIKGVETSFHQLQTTLAPVVDSVVSLGAKTVSDLMPALGKLATAGASVIDSFLKPFDTFVKSASFGQLISQMSQLAVQAGNILGPALVKLIQQMLQLFVQVAPQGIAILAALLPAFSQLFALMAPGIEIIAKLVAATIQWLAQNHLLVPVLVATAAIVALLMGASGIGGITLAIVAVSAAIGFFATHWQQIWQDIKNWTNDALNFIKNLFNAMPGWLQAPIKVFVDFWKAEWDITKTVVTAVIDFIKSNWNTISEIIEAPVKVFIAFWQAEWKITETVVSGAVSAIKAAWSVIEAILEAPFKAAEAVIMGIIHGIEAAISAVGSAISGLVNAAKAVGNVIGSVASAVGLASGGIVGAATGGVQGGLRLVGEHGPELVKLPTGSSVYSNSDTMSMGGNGNQTITLEVAGGASEFEQFMANFIKKYVRTRGGGQVQKAFGY